MTNIPGYLLVVTTTAAGLIAGLFYSWSCGITQGLGKLTDVEYLRAMQSINRDIQRPIFLLLFVGLVLLLPVCAWLSHRHQQQGGFVFLSIASIAYIGGVFLVTIAGNVPLNNMLDETALSGATPELLSRTRTAFEVKWNSLNVLRTVCAIITLICSILAVSSSKHQI
jgi:uncharacterized membrane protein